MKDYRGAIVKDSPKRNQKKQMNQMIQKSSSVSSVSSDSSDSSPRIHKHMIVQDILTILPEAESVIAEYGLHCFHCSANALETLEEGCLSHGFEQEEIDELVDDLNQMLADKPAKPQIVIITPAAARAVRKIIQEETSVSRRLKSPDDARGRSQSPTGTIAGLEVATDGHSGFCMEVREDPAEGDLTFMCPEEADVRFFASPLTLAVIGGATIDYREERFKLDLPEDAMKKCACGKTECGCGGNCSCKK